MGGKKPARVEPASSVEHGGPSGFAERRPHPWNASLNIFMEASQDFLSASAS